MVSSESSFLETKLKIELQPPESLPTFHNQTGYKFSKEFTNCNNIKDKDQTKTVNIKQIAPSIRNTLKNIILQSS